MLRPLRTALFVIVGPALFGGCGAAVPSISTVTNATTTPSTTTSTPTPMPTARATSTVPPAEARLLLYQSPDGLTLVRSDGTDRHDLFPAGSPLENALHADWSPDGSRIVFQVGGNDDPDLWITEADGSHAQLLFDCSQPCINADSPAWSPNGRTVAFSELDEARGVTSSKLQLVNVETGTVTTVVTSEINVLLNEPRWSPDGHAIVLAIEERDGPDGRYLDHPAHSAIGVVTPEVADAAIESLTDADTNASYPDWHPSLDLIVFQAGPNVWWDAVTSSEANLFSIRPDGSGLEQLTSFALSDPAIWLPAWSADGQAILVTQTIRATSENTLAALDADGSNLRSLPGPIPGAHVREQPLP